MSITPCSAVEMKLVVFGLSVSSSWGNGHATLLRALIGALAALGHRVVFFERDEPYYARERDLWELPGGRLVLYSSWDDVLTTARAELAGAEAAMVTSYCPDGAAAAELLFDTAGPLGVYYDLDTPVTLKRLRVGQPVPYLGSEGLAGFDLVLSYTGGAALDALRQRLGARRVAPLYGWADPAVHRPTKPRARYRADLSYLGTYAADRQQALQSLFVESAGLLPSRRFLIGGSQYPEDFPWRENIYYVHHLPPAEHPAFYSSSRLTLNLTRAPMVEMGYCPPGRMFEAAACGAPLLSDEWEGLDDFFRPGVEILTARTTADVLAAMELSDSELAAIARAGRERTLADHTAARRAVELVALLEGATGAGTSAPARELWVHVGQGVDG